MRIFIILSTFLANLIFFQNSSAVASSQPKFEVYLDRPFVQASYVSGSTNSLSEDFNSFSISGGGPSPCTNVTLAIGVVSNDQCNMWPNNDDLGAITTNSNPVTNDISGTLRGSNFAATGTGGGFTVSFAEPQKYVGFWWSAGSPGNAVEFYSNGLIVASMDVGDLAHAGTLVYLLGGAPDCTSSATYLSKVDKVQAINTQEYLTRNYFGPPWGYPSPTPQSCNSSAARGEAYAYIHAFALSGATFDAIKFAGNNFELDNLTISKNIVTPESYLVLLSSINAAANTYSVAYDENSGTGRSGGDSTYVVGQPFALPSTPPTRADYYFTGWFTERNGGTRAGGTSDLADVGATANITLYAQWSYRLTSTEIQLARNNSSVTGNITQGESLTLGARATFAGTSNAIPDTAGSYKFLYIDASNVAQTLPGCQSVAMLNAISFCNFVVPTGISPITFVAEFSPSDSARFQPSSNSTNPFTSTAVSSGGSGGGGGIVNAPTRGAQLPGITWSPAPIRAGERLTNKQLNAEFSVPGSASYSIPIGTILKAGKVEIRVTFTPDDVSSYLVLEVAEVLEVLPSEEYLQTEVEAIFTDPATIDTKDLKILGTIYFRNNEYFLDAGDREQLKILAKTAKSDGYRSILIFGNTDIKRGVDNTWLSKARASAVFGYLKQNKMKAKLTKAWFGPTRPVANGTDKKSLALNRRVEIYLLK